ncbi:hypothetical protein BDF19DRAFT_464749, partial [Syncephalis fuscata]
MKLSISVVCTLLVTFVATTAMVDAKPALARRAPEDDTDVVYMRPGKLVLAD